MLKAEASGKQNYTASMVSADMKSLYYGHQQDDNDINSEMKDDYRYSALNQQHTERGWWVRCTISSFPSWHEIYSDICTKQMLAHQRTATFFIFADLCLMKRAAIMLLVPTGAFWIARPLGLSKEWNVENSFTPDWFLVPIFCIASELVLRLNCRGLRIGEADRSLPEAS